MTRLAYDRIFALPFAGLAAVTRFEIPEARAPGEAGCPQREERLLRTLRKSLQNRDAGRRNIEIMAGGNGHSHELNLHTQSSHVYETWGEEHWEKKHKAKKEQAN